MTTWRQRGEVASVEVSVRENHIRGNRIVRSMWRIDERLSGLYVLLVFCNAVSRSLGFPITWLTITTIGSNPVSIWYYYYWLLLLRMPEMQAWQQEVPPWICTQSRANEGVARGGCN